MSIPSAEPFDGTQDNIEEWVSNDDKKGTRIIGHRPGDIGKAKTVRVRKGKLLVTDGPFTETKEWIGGFDLLECNDVDEAIQIAAKHPMAASGHSNGRAWQPGTCGAAHRSADLDG